jgi:hypothetical protein
MMGQSLPSPSLSVQSLTKDPFFLLSLFSLFLLEEYVTRAIFAREKRVGE